MAAPRSTPRSTLRLLPALVLVMLAVLPAYVGSLWTGVASLAVAEEAAPKAEAHAEAEAPTKPEEQAKAEDQANPEEQRKTEDHAVAPADEMQGADAGHGTEAGHGEAAPGEFDPLSLTRAEIDLLRQLAKRRDELDVRARELDDRAVLLQATEARIAAQVEEMKQLKAEYQALKSQRDDAAEGNLRRLVTVYEAMKPEEAARIFETMEGTVLLDVITRMGERRLAPILAQMTPAKAQALTVAMAHRKSGQLAAKPEG